jgi:flagellin
MAQLQIIRRPFMPSFNTNIGSLQVQNALTVNNRALEKSTAQLSTGLRVNSAADDAAALAVGNQMTQQILSLNQAVRNANDGISMLQTADGATDTIVSILGRMKQLAIQSANDTNGESDREALHAEFTELQTAISTVIGTTRWNDHKVLNGSMGTVNLQIGAVSNDKISVSFANLSDLAVLNSSGLNTSADAVLALGDVNSSLDSVTSARSTWGGIMNRLGHAADNASNVSMNMNVSRSQLLDVDYAKATAELARSQIIQEAGSAMLSQANHQPLLVLHLLS